VSLRLHPDTIGVQEGIIVFWELVTGKERNVFIGYVFDPIQKQIGVLLSAFPDHKGQD
jgi:hypothetical protein